MKIGKLSLFLTIIITLGLFCETYAGGDTTSAKKNHYEPNWKSLSQWKMPKWFDDAVLGIYSHWGVFSVPGYPYPDGSEQVDSDIEYGRLMYIPDSSSEYNYGVYDFHHKTYGDPCKFGYKDLIPLFKAQKWDPNRWARLYKYAGADFAGTMAVHADGFCMWNTKYQKNNSYDIGPHRDVLGELFKALRKQGLKTVATFHERPAEIFNTARRYCPKGVDANNPKYAYIYTKPSFDIMNKELLEVVDKYRPDQLWFEDEYCGEKNWKPFMAYYFNSAEKWGKDVMITQKHGEAPPSCSVLDLEDGIFPKGQWIYIGMKSPQKQRWQFDAPMGNYWAYAKGVGCRPVNMLVDGIVDRISKNGVTLLDVAPKADGTLPQEQIDGLKELGKWMSINKEALYAAKPAPFVEGGVDTWEAGTIRFTEKGIYLYAIELGNEWPPLSFAEYKDSTPPKAPLKIPGVRPVKDSKIFLLGSSMQLPWHQEGNDLVIEKLPDPLPCDYAWSFKIKVH